jgi:glutamyl-tRNA reductase
LSVEAVDTLLTELTKKRLTGIGAARITILGAGNLGAKLALKLVERGAKVTITQRKKEKLDTIVEALNYIKPDYTTSYVSGTIDNEAAAKGAEILIGATQGIPVITPEMIGSLADKAIVLDVGKGTLCPEAISLAENKNIDIYRLDITASLEGLISALWATEEIVNTKMGRRMFHNESLVSGGFLGRKNEIVVDNVWSPERIYGIADGKGDFVRNLSVEQLSRIESLQALIDRVNYV